MISESQTSFARGKGRRLPAHLQKNRPLPLVNNVCYMPGLFLLYPHASWCPKMFLRGSLRRCRCTPSSRPLFFEKIFRHESSLDSSRDSTLHAQAVAPGPTQPLGGQMSPHGSLERYRWRTSTGPLNFKMYLPPSNNNDFRTSNRPARGWSRRPPIPL